MTHKEAATSEITAFSNPRQHVGKHQHGLLSLDDTNHRLQGAQQFFASSHPRVTLLMLLCGLIGAATGAAAVNAAPADDGVPRLAIKYAPESLDTDAGAKAVYQRLVRAAAEVCPGLTTGSRVLSTGARECREKAVAQAVHLINNPRLAAAAALPAKTG